eukprot:6564687-Karenia_brevis.AAC.1
MAPLQNAYVGHHKSKTSGQDSTPGRHAPMPMSMICVSDCHQCVLISVGAIDAYAVAKLLT